MCIGDIGLDSVFLFVVLGFGVFTGGLNVQRGARTAPNGVPRGGLSDYPTYCPNPWEQKLPKSLEYGASLCRGKLQKSLEAHVVVVFGVVNAASGRHVQLALRSERRRSERRRVHRLGGHRYIYIYIWCIYIYIYIYTYMHTYV